MLYHHSFYFVNINVRVSINLCFNFLHFDWRHLLEKVSRSLSIPLLNYLFFVVINRCYFHHYMDLVFD